MTNKYLYELISNFYQKSHAFITFVFKNHEKYNIDLQDIASLTNLDFCLKHNFCPNSSGKTKGYNLPVLIPDALAQNILKKIANTPDLKSQKEYEFYKYIRFDKKKNNTQSNQWPLRYYVHKVYLINENYYITNEWYYDFEEQSKTQNEKRKIEDQNKLNFLFWILNKCHVTPYILKNSIEKYRKQTNTAYGQPLLDLYQTYYKKPEYNQTIYFGTPGSGKSQKVKRILKQYPEDCVFRTTFHPDTDYASFIGSYKPKMLDDAKTIGYEFVPQIFTNAYVKAWQNQNQEVFLIIEEINRGNCAQIFGDIFQLLDRDNDGYSEYPIKADTDLNDYLSKKEIYKNINDDRISDGKLCLPPNLSIIATMNTSDQSLFPMDSAFKRRWDWEYVPSEDNDENDFTILLKGNDNNLAYKWHSFRKAINDKIKETTDSEDKQLGSFFIKSDVNKEQFKSKVMFYLWSEVFKEEYHTGKNHFRSNITKENQQDKDNSKEEYHEFTFNELYEKNDIEMLAGFMKYLKVKTKAEEDSEKKEKNINNNN